MKQAVLYCRVSSQEQIKGDGPERQKRNGERYVEEQGWSLADVLSDEGKSAYHARNRAEGAALHQFEIEARNGFHRGKVLCVENVDRLSRQGAKAAAQLIWALNDAGVDVATWQDGKVFRAGEGGDIMDLFKLIIEATMSYEESLKKAERLQEKWVARHKRIELGDPVGKSGAPSKIRPFWIDIEGNRYVLNKAHAATVNQIFDWYIDGMGLDLIVKRLNEAYVPSKASYRKIERGWGKSKIYNILTRREAIGEYTTRKGVTLSTTYYPPAVTHEKFNRARDAMNKRKRTGGPEMKRAANLLTGMVRCAYCGGNGVYETQSPTTSPYKSRRTGEVRVYHRTGRRTLRCDHQRRRLNCDNDTILKYEVVEATILDGLLPLIVNKGQEATATKLLREQIAKLAREKETTEERLATTIDLLIDCKSSALRARMDELEALTQSQQASIDALRQELDISLAAPSEKDDIALVEALRADLSTDDDELRIATSKRVNMALRRLVNRIDIEVGQFRVWIDDGEWYLFDADGVMLESEQAYQIAAE